MRFLVLMVALLCTSHSFALADNFCNEKALPGLWYEGIGWGKKVPSLVANISPEHQKVAALVEGFPVVMSDEEVIRSLGVKPESTIRLVENAAYHSWTMVGKSSEFAMTIFFYKGCISTITVMDGAGMKAFHKENKLPTSP